MTDVLDTLARANPRPDETLTADERHAADALLARLLTEPTTDPAPAPRPRRALRLPRLDAWGGLAAGLAAVAAAVLLLAGRGPTVAERAYAAVSKNLIYHTVAYSYLQGRQERTGQILEAFYDLGGAPAYRTVQYATRADGLAKRAEFAADPSGTHRYVAGFPRGTRVTFDPDEPARRYDPFRVFKAAYKRGDVRSEGRTTYQGKAAYRLVVVDGDTRSTYVVDAKTYLPLEQRDVTEQDGKRYEGVTEYLGTERLRRTAANRAKLRFRAPTKRPLLDALTLSPSDSKTASGGVATAAAGGQATVTP